MKTLFVGGPWDGRRVEVNPAMKTFQVSAPVLTSMPVPEEASIFEYRRERLIERGRDFTVMFYGGNKSLIGTLINGYKTPQEYNGEQNG